MSNENFRDILNDLNINYSLEDNRIIVYGSASIDLDSIEEIPSNVIFSCPGGVHMTRIKKIPSGVIFKTGNLWLGNLEHINPSVEFYSTQIYVPGITGTPFKYLNQWRGNIPYIESWRLFNLMIKKELFV